MVSLMEWVQRVTRYMHNISTKFFFLVTLMAVIEERRNRLFGAPYSTKIHEYKDSLFQKFLNENFDDSISS